MGEVYLAVDTRLSRKVALKHLSDPLSDAAPARDRLLREARAAAQITHPNIAAIYDILETESKPWIVMEYAQGETLAAIVRRGAMKVEAALSIAARLADALARAHAAGVIHRDLKPANVILTPDGTPKVLDFGLARAPWLALDAAPAEGPTIESPYASIAQLAGTPGYMAPELLLGAPATTLSDIFGLGVLMFEILSGRHPFEAPDTSSLALAVLGKPAPPVSSINPLVPTWVDRLVAKAMAREPADRYQSAAELAADLRQADEAASRGRVTTGGVTAPVRSDAPISRTRRTARSLGIGSAVVATAAIVLALFPGIWRRHTPAIVGAGETSVVAVLPLSNASGDPALDRLGVGVSESLIAALHGVRAITVAPRTENRTPSEPMRDVPRLARDLGANIVIGGTVLGGGDHLQFAVSMQKSDGTSVWEQRFNGSERDLLQIQARAAGDIVDALGVRVSAAERDRLRRPPTTSLDAYTDYSIGRTLLGRPDVAGNAGKALDAFTRATQKDASFAWAFAGLADACWEQYRASRERSWPERARSAIEQALRLAPDDGTIRLSLVAAYASTGRFTQAESLAREALALDPGDAEAHRLLAGALKDQGRTEEAEAQYQQAIALRPAGAANHLAIGLFFYEAGRYSEAVGAFTRVTELQPDNVWGYLDLGAAYQNMGDSTRALAVYQKALAVSNTGAIHTNIGNIYWAEGRFADAAHAFEEALALEPNDAVKHGNLADAYVRLGRRTEARQEYRRAAELTRDELAVNPRDARALARRALFEAKSGLMAEAVQDARDAVALSPDDMVVLYKRAVVHALAGQQEEAAAWLDRALQKGYSRSQARNDIDLEKVRRLPQVAALLRENR
jgi:tetratricopeptide (TPR) repeat protein/TolB-like protein